MIEINPLTDDIDRALLILDERGFNYDVNTANSIKDVINQVDSMIEGDR